MKKVLYVILLLNISSLYGQSIIRNLQWLNVNYEITELTTHNGLTLYAETENINNNEVVDIKIWEKGEENDFLVGEYISRVVDNEILFHWILDFNRDVTEDEEESGFTVLYYFTIQYNKIISHRSNSLDVLYWIRQQIKEAGGNYIYANRKFLIIFSNDEIMEVWSDEEGYLYLENLRFWGNVFFAPLRKDINEEHEPIPARREPEKPVYYKVKEGDSLWKIASYDFIYDNPYLWTLLYEANRHNFINHNNADLIEVGQAIIIPGLGYEIRDGTR
jgi:hypothetical protein